MTSKIWHLPSKREPLHDLILGQAGGLGFHSISTTARSLILDEAQTKRATTVLVTRELLDSGLRIFGSVEADNASASGSAVWLILDFGLLNLSDGSEEFDQILVAC
jgi:hypothetical protein